MEMLLKYHLMDIANIEVFKNVVFKRSGSFTDMIDRFHLHVYKCNITSYPSKRDLVAMTQCQSRV